MAFGEAPDTRLPTSIGAPLTEDRLGTCFHHKFGQSSCVESWHYVGHRDIVTDIKKKTSLVSQSQQVQASIHFYVDYRCYALKRMGACVAPAPLCFPSLQTGLWYQFQALGDAAEARPPDKGGLLCPSFDITLTDDLLRLGSC